MIYFLLLASTLLSGSTNDCHNFGSSILVMANPDYSYITPPEEEDFLREMLHYNRKGKIDAGYLVFRAKSLTICQSSGPFVGVIHPENNPNEYIFVNQYQALEIVEDIHTKKINIETPTREFEENIPKCSTTLDGPACRLPATWEQE